MIGEGRLRTSARLDMMAFMLRGEGFVLFHCLFWDPGSSIQDPVTTDSGSGGGIRVYTIRGCASVLGDTLWLIAGIRTHPSLALNHGKRDHAWERKKRAATSPPMYEHVRTYVRTTCSVCMFCVRDQHVRGMIYTLFCRPRTNYVSQELCFDIYIFGKLAPTPEAVSGEVGNIRRVRTYLLSRQSYYLLILQTNARTDRHSSQFSGEVW